MSYSISTLLTRNLQDVFGENDPARRRAAINEIFTEDCVFYDPNGGVYRGRDAGHSILQEVFGFVKEKLSEAQRRKRAGARKGAWEKDGTSCPHLSTQ